MKKLMMVMATAIAAAMPLMADMETVGGYTWTYRIRNDGTAEINNSYSCAVSPSPTGAVTIPSMLGGKPVTSIGDYAFYICSGLTSVTIPDSVTSIGESAFYGCSGLTSVTIPEGVTSIGYAAFDCCSGLRAVTVSQCVLDLQICNVFSSVYSSLTNVSYSSVITNIGSFAFSGCRGLTSVTIPDGVTSIGGWAFYGCSSLQAVTLPDSLVSCLCDEVFYGTPFLSSKKFPAFILSRSGKKLFGVKHNDAVWDPSACRDAVIPATVTQICDYALGCFGAKIEYDGEVYDTTFSEGNVVRIVFAGTKPKASDKAFAREDRVWDEAAGEYVESYWIDWGGVYYHEGNAGWKWGAEWCGVKTYALNEMPAAYAKESKLKFGRVYGGEQSSGSGWSGHYIWDNNDIGLYGDEYAFIPVTGTGTIKPVIYGDVPSGYLETAEIWTDQKMFDTFTPKGVATSKWKSDEEGLWYYEISKGEWEWPKELWPKKKVVSGRRWIVIHAKEKKLWSGVWSFRVGLDGTSEISDPIIVVPSEEFDGNGLLSKYTPSDFMRGLTFSGYENFEAWDQAMSSPDYSYWDADRPVMQTFEIEYWRASLAGKAMTFKVAVPSAGTLVISSEDDDDDSPAMKNVFSITGSGIVSDKATVKSENWESPDYRYNVTNFWKTSTASHIRRIEVNKATTLTFTSKTDDDDCEFNRMYFFPKSGKSVAVDVGYIVHEDHDGAYDYWGRNYVQGYVTGGGVYKSGETVTLKAVTGSGEKFDHWEVRFGNLTLTEAQKTSTTLSFKVTDEMCGAMKDEEQIFISAIWKPKYKVTALPSIVGAGTVTGTGRYHEGTSVTLTATANSGYDFVKWSDGETAVTRTVEVVAADVEHVIYALFQRNGDPVGGQDVVPVSIDSEYSSKQEVSGVLCDAQGNISGTVTVKIGKKGKNGIKVSATATLLADGKAKKVSAKAVTIDVDGGVTSGKLVFKGIGEMEFKIWPDGSVTLENGGYAMSGETVGGNLPNGTMVFAVDVCDLPSLGAGYEIVEDVLPLYVTAKVSGGKKIDFGKAATLKYAKDKASGTYLLLGLDEPKKPNLSGLKLTYTPKTGQFKGSFKIYAKTGDAKPKLKKYTVNVIGIVVDGVGVGEATLKKPAVKWDVTFK